MATLLLFLFVVVLFASWFYGGDSEGETPGSIPNPEVKVLCADGTALVMVWESRLLPVF